MTKKLNVKINQGIVSILGKKLYSSNFFTVILRELLQNSLDANATKIDVFFDVHTNTLTIRDNGQGIQKIEGLLDTIGESIKSLDNPDSIGGYGLAKLAIFSCKQWEFLSISGKFSTGYIYDENDTIPSGTQVKCQFTDEDTSWNTIGQITSYLRMINRPVEFTINDENIIPYEYSFIMIDGKNELSCNSSSNGYIQVRVNGLPSFKTWIPNLTKTIVFDYQVTCTPYDSDYPLTSNRDAFIENSSEYKDYNQRKTNLQNKLESDKKMSENMAKKTKLTGFRGGKYLSGGNVTSEDYKTHSTLIYTYQRYIQQIAECNCNDVNDVLYGLTDGLQGELAMYSPSENAFLISIRVSGKGDILALALHEFTHFLGYGRNGHDQEFSSKLTDLTGKILYHIFNGEFRK